MAVALPTWTGGAKATPELPGLDRHGSTKCRRTVGGFPVFRPRSLRRSRALAPNGGSSLTLGARVPLPLPMTATTAESYERAAERLLGAVTAACKPGVPFAEQVEAALRATLKLFVAEPDLGHLLTVRPFDGGEETVTPYLHWQQRYAELLATAAARDPAAYRHPSFVAPSLVSGVCWRISQHLQAEWTERLEELLPDLLEFVFVSYFGAERANRLARAR